MIHKVKEVKQDRDELKCVIERQLFYNEDYRITIQTLLNWWFYDWKMSSYDHPKCNNGKYNTMWNSLLTMVIATWWWYDVWPYLDDMYQMWYVECYSMQTDWHICSHIDSLSHSFYQSDNVSWSKWVSFSSYTASIFWDYYYICKLPTNSYFDLHTMENIDL